MTTPATSTAPPALPVGGSTVPTVPTVQRRHRIVIGTVASSTLLVAGVALSLFVGARSVDPTVV